MANFNKNWGDLSDKRQQKLIEEFGSKKAWQNAKSKSQGYKDKFKNPVDTQDGRIEAPSWYRNADGTTPSTMQPGMSKDKWQRSLDNAAAKKTGDDSRQNAIKAADNYLDNHPNRGQGGVKDAEYDRILKEGGLTNHTYQQMKKAQGKQQFEANKEAKFDSIEAQQQAKYEVNQAGGKDFHRYGSAKNAFVSNRESGDFYMTNSTNDGYDNYGNDSNNLENESLADKLVKSGNDFSWADYGMHRNDGKENSFYNYDAYGGYDNWYNNHSAYSEGGWKGSQNVMDSGEIASGNQKRANTRNEHRLSDDYMNKYGKYDWAQNYYNNNNNK